MTRWGSAFAALAILLFVGSATAAPPGGPPRQSDTAFAGSYSAQAVTNVSVTTRKTSCYKPEVFYDGALPDSAGYPGGGSSGCVAPSTGEYTGPYDTQDVAGGANPTLLVKDHSESDIRADPNNPDHLI